MRPYERYVPSGVEWIGDIPEGWKIKRLKYLGKLIIGLTYSPDNLVASEDDGILVLRSSNIQGGKLDLADTVYVDAEIPTHLIVVENDLLICSRNGSKNLIGKNALITLEGKPKTFGAFMTIFRSKYARFIRYVLNSDLFDFQADSCMTSTVNQLTTSNLNSMQIPFPTDTDTQTAIADYLDRETAKIDSIIKTKETLVERLKEKRLSVISHAVTKGLGQNSKMKPSGVEWIGDIPEGWGVKKLKYISFLRNIKTDNSELTYIALEHIESNTGKLIKREDDEVQPDAECIAFYCDDVLFCKLRPYLAKCILSSFDGKCSSELLVLQESGFLKAKYLFFVALSHGFLEIVNSSTYGSKMPRASWNFIGNMSIPLPDTDTQTAIADYLDTETTKIDSTIETTKLSIEKLKEYRTALISACVTGKIDVRS